MWLICLENEHKKDDNLKISHLFLCTFFSILNDGLGTPQFSS